MILQNLDPFIYLLETILICVYAERFIGVQLFLKQELRFQN